MSRIRTNKNICLNCFGDLGPERICGACKRKADDSPAPLHHLPQRTVIHNKYLLGKALGEGGFGITYLAWDTEVGAKVAIKEYYPSSYVQRVPKTNQVIINAKSNLGASNRGLKRFIEEAKTMAKIKNLAGIVAVRDFFSANGTAYIVMEFLDGISLKKHMARKGKLPVDDVLTIMRPVIDSLAQVHKIGLIHRDISPDNIIITKKNEVKLIDFGAAKQSNLDGKSLSIVLKQGFAPEEQYRTHGEQGPWTDVYALAVTIYYCISGKMPPESIQRMYKDTIQKPSDLGVEISEQQEKALLKALAVYAKSRYQDCTQLINGLYNGAKRVSSKPAAVEVMAADMPKATAAPKPESKRPSIAAVPPKRTTISTTKPDVKKTVATAPGGNKTAVATAPKSTASKANVAGRDNTEVIANNKAITQVTAPKSTQAITPRPSGGAQAKAVSIEPTASKPPKKGLFARLFGKKK